MDNSLKESRRLYLLIIVMLIAAFVMLTVSNKRAVATSYKNGVDKGRLEMLQSFRSLYLPALPEDNEPLTIDN